MTDFETNKTLALAIGWKESQLKVTDAVFVWCGHWRVFDYRDWNVIGPIAERYECFPRWSNFVSGWRTDFSFGVVCPSDTPQKAIALAVIGARP